MASAEEKRTPMAWQHRDMNYHQSAYTDRYGGGMEYSGGRTGPPSSSDRLSHRTDKSWRTRESQPPFRGAGTPGSASGYSRDPSGSQYAPSRPSYSSGRPASRPQSPGTTTESTSSSEDETGTEDTRIGRGPPLSLQPQSLYGYGGYYPGGPMQPPPGFHPSQINGYPGTMKSSKSVPAMTMGTWNGEPCPVHGVGPFSLPGPMPLPPPPPHMMNPGAIYGPVGPLSMPPPMGPRRAASIYDMRNHAMIYGSLPPRPAGDRRSLVGGPLSAVELQSIPPQFLPPMSRPRPVVVSEDGTAERLPVRSPPEKNGSIAGLMSKMSREENLKKKRKCTKGAGCVFWIIISVIFMGIVIGLLLSFIM